MSLATVVAFGLSSSLFAADSLSSAFKDGKFTGNLKAYYFNKDIDKKGSDDILALGAEVGYISAPLYGFNIGLDLQSSTNAGTGNGVGDDDFGLFKGTMEASGAQLSEAYIQYNFDNLLFAKAGRQFMDTPLVSGSGNRLVRESFESYLGGVTFYKSLIMGGYITKYQARTDGKGDIGNFEDHQVVTSSNILNNEGAWTILATTQYLNNFNLTGQMLIVSDGEDNINGSSNNIRIYYGEATYTDKFAPFGLCLAGQYIHSDADDIQNDSSDNLLFDTASNTFGFKADLKNIADTGIRLTAAYNNTDEYSDTYHGLGNGSDWGYVGHVVKMDNTYTADTDSFMGEIGYDFGKIGVDGLQGVFAYSVWSGMSDMYGNADIDADEIYAKLAYNFAGELKGLKSSLEYSDEGKDKDSQQFRLRLQYNFAE